MKVELPELPEAAIKTAHPAANAFSYGYHADQMTDYARLAVTQAVAAERARWEAEVAGLVEKWRREQEECNHPSNDPYDQGSADTYEQCADELAGLNKKD